VLAIDAHLLELSELVIFRGFASCLRTESEVLKLRFQFRVVVHEALDDDREILEEEVVIVSLILHIDIMMSSAV
jgi:hypothetical protein